MPWSGGTFSRSYDWTDDAAGSFPNIEASRMDGEDDNFESGINDCLHKAGQNTPTADLPMGGNNHTGVGNATALDEYASAADVIDQHLTYYVDTGSADAYVITPSPAISAYAEGQKFTFRALAANTGATTLNVNGLGAIDVETNDGVALAAGSIAIGGYYEVIYDANGTRFVLTSPTSLDVLRTDTDVDHDATTNFVADEHIDHTSVTITAGSGLSYSSGGTDISASSTIDLDISALTAITASELAATDIVLIDDGAGGTNRAMEVQEMGMRVQTGQGSKTLAAADMNSIMEFTGIAELTLPLNATTALPVGVPIALNVKHATEVLTVTAAASVTLVSIYHPAGEAAESDTVSAGGTALLYKTAADVWCLSGDITD